MSTIFFNRGSTSSITNTADINLTGIEIVNDTTPELGGDLDALGNKITNINELQIEHPGPGTTPIKIGSVAPNNAWLKVVGTGFAASDQRRVGAYYAMDHGSGDVFKGGHYFRHQQSGNDQFHLFFTSDNGLTQDNFLFAVENDSVSIVNNYDLNIDGGKVLAGVIECATLDTDVNSIVNVTTMPVSDNLHNHIRMTMDYGANNVPDSANGLLNFSMKSDAEGDMQTARIGANYDTSNNNVLRLSASDNSANFTDYDFGHDFAALGAAVQFVNYTTTERNALSPAAGWVIYNTTDNKLQCYDGTSWNDLF